MTSALPNGCHASILSDSQSDSAQAKLSRRLGPDGYIRGVEPFPQRHHVSPADLRMPLRMYAKVVKRIERYTHRLNEARDDRARTEARLRRAEASRRNWLAFIARGLGIEQTAVTLGLSPVEVRTARDAAERELFESNRAAIEEFMSLPEQQRRLRKHDL